VAGGPILPTAVAAADSGPGAASGAAGTSAAAARSSRAKIVLEVGSRGGLVAALQRRLDEVLPSSHLAVDGIYGPLTRAAVVDYQRRHGFLADGKVDADMWAGMFDAPVLVFGASPSAGVSTAARSRSHRASASPRSAVKHRARDGGAALSGRTSAERTPTSTAPSSAAAGSGGSLVAGGPGSAASSPSPASGNSSGGGAAIEVVSPTVTATPQTSTYVLTNGVALPLPRQYLTGGYVDQGVDYAAPGGTPEYAMGDGVIIGEGISGFGPNAPILKITSGPLTGLEVYYGHAGSDLVRVGQHVKAGQQITQVGYGIVGISTGPHLEIGFYPPGRMGAGSKMLAVINSLLKQHPTGRAWVASTTSSVHVARDTAASSTTASVATSTGSGGAAIESDSTAQAAVPASAPAPPAPTSTASAAPTEAPAAAPAPDPAPSSVTAVTSTSTPATSTSTPSAAPAPSQEPSATKTASASTGATTTPTTTTPTSTTTPAPTPTATTTAPPAVTPTTPEATSPVTTTTSAAPPTAPVVTTPPADPTADADSAAPPPADPTANPDAAVPPASSASDTTPQTTTPAVSDAPSTPAPSGG
jgi:peptidoglycan hydrolase-like protein with peptidoglycan-binding domain